MNLNQQLALIPHPVLNTVLVNHNRAPVDDKAEAVNQVINLLADGSTTLDAIRATKPAAIVSAPAGADADTREIVNRAAVAASAAADAANALIRRASTLTEGVQALQKATVSQVNDLAADLTALVKTLTKPDPAQVSAEINAAVAALFDQFRERVSTEQVKQIANSLPVYTLRRCGDIFGDKVCRYDGVDFSDVQIAVWSDPESPAIVDDYVFNPSHLHQTVCALNDELPDNVWLAGERGTGKSEFVTQIAARLGRRLFRVNFDEALERADFIGGNTIENGSVVWKAGIIAQAIQHPGALILLDEIGFARAQALATLHALCERSPHRAVTISETGVRIPVASHVAFFCADNSNGFGDGSGNFAGVREQNSAFIDRFSYTLEFQYLPPKQEAALIHNRTGLPLAASTMIVGLANVAREKARAGLLTQPPSLRQLFAWARLVQRGVPVESAFKSAVVNKFPSDCAVELHGIFISQIDSDAFAKAVKS
jgi:MoxR-like ATPase